MWTRRSVASSGPEKIRLLLRSSFLRRYLAIRESHLLSDALIHHRQASVESHQGAELCSVDSQTRSIFPTSSKSISNQETKKLRDCVWISDHLSRRSNVCSLEPGHFPPYLNVKGSCILPGSGRQFASLSCPNDEDDNPSDGIEAIVDSENAASNEAGSSETWHTKLSAILATDQIATNGSKVVAETASVSDQIRRSGGDTATDFRSKPTPFSVCQTLRNERDVDVAWRYFTRLQHQEGYKHGVDTYNTMVQCLCGAKRFGTIFELLETMRGLGFPLTYSTCVRIMKSLAGEMMYDKALAFFKSVENYGCNPNAVVYNAYLDILVKAGHYSLVESTYVTMSQGGIVPDIYTYNILINGFRRADQVEKALQIYREMKQRGSFPNVVTYNTLLHALGQAGRTDEVLELFCEMAEKDVAPSAFTYSTLLHIFGKDPRNEGRMMKWWNGKGRNQEVSSTKTSIYKNLVWTLCNKQDIASGLRILRELELQGHTISLATYNLLAVFLADAGKSYAVLELFRDMKAKRCVPDVFTYKTVVESACRAHRAEEALSLHKEMMREGHAVPVATYNMLIDVAAKAGQVDTAFELFSQMQLSCKPDMYTYNILIFTLCTLRKTSDALTCLNKAGITSEGITSGEQAALELFRRMKAVTGPDAVTYHTLIHALCRSGRVNDCQNLLLEMEGNGFDPGVLVYNKVLNLFGRAGKEEKAWKLFLKMQSNNLPDLITYTTLIKYLAKAGSFGKATKLLEDMERKGFVPNIITYTTLVDGLARSRRFVEVDRLFKHMAKKGCFPDTYAYNSLVAAYCKAGQVAKAYRVFEESIDKGCIPDTYTYTTLIEGYFRSGNINDALDMYNVMRGMGCNPNGVTYNILLEGLSKAGRVDELAQILEDISQQGVALTGVSEGSLARAMSLTGRGDKKVAVAL